MSGLGKYLFSERKNAILERERGIGFASLIQLIESGHVVDVINHPNQKRYPGQKIYLLNVKGYIWAIPFRYEGEHVKLFTAFPHRKINRQYRRNRNDENKIKIQ